MAPGMKLARHKFFFCRFGTRLNAIVFALTFGPSNVTTAILFFTAQNTFACKTTVKSADCKKGEKGNFRGVQIAKINSASVPFGYRSPSGDEAKTNVPWEAVGFCDLEIKLCWR